MISHISTELSHQTFFSAFYFLFFLQNHWTKYFEYSFYTSIVWAFASFSHSSCALHRQQWMWEKSVENSWKSISDSRCVLFCLSFHFTHPKVVYSSNLRCNFITFLIALLLLISAQNKQTNRRERENIFFIQNNTWNTKRDNPKVDGEGYLSALRATVRQETKGKFSHARNGKVQKCSKKSFTLTPNCWLFRKKEDFK